MSDSYDVQKLKLRKKLFHVYFYNVNTINTYTLQKRASCYTAYLRFFSAMYLYIGNIFPCF